MCTHKSWEEFTVWTRIGNDRSATWDTPVYKGQSKDPRDPGSYRPIAILTAISKILEIAVREALLSWFDMNEFLPDSQYGFRPGRSVSMALTVAQNDWIHAKSKNEVVGLMAH